MKPLNIVHALRLTSHGGLSFQDIQLGRRGVTGSEAVMLQLAEAQAELGHRVSVLCPTETGQHGRVRMVNVEEAYPRLRGFEKADVVIEWVAADLLRYAPESAVRIHSIQINDHLLDTPGYEAWVDHFVCASEPHREWLWRMPGHPRPDAPVTIIPNFVDLAAMPPPAEKRPGKCAYFSSPDRGLHFLLAMWPEIKMACPEAELHIYYELTAWVRFVRGLASEVGQRARYVISALERFKLAERQWENGNWTDLQIHLDKPGRYDVYVHGAVAPAQLWKDLADVDCFLYPCETVSPTEGFSVSTLTAMALGLVPVITDCDALGHIYGESGAAVVPLTPGPPTWVDAYLERAITLLTDRGEMERRRTEVRAFAKQYDKTVVVKQWMDLIKAELVKKGRA